MPNARSQPADVFLNTPYDQKFERFFLAYISGISAFGFSPRATLEIPSSSRRLERIMELIGSCEYSIHDLSRVQLDAKAPRTPRFNMPFELGLAVAHQRRAIKAKHKWLVCECMHYRLAKSLSDLNGTDPFIHGGTIAGVFRELCNMFRRPGRQPSIQQMGLIYRELRASLPRILRQAGARSVYSSRVFKDVSVAASASADRIVR